MRAVDIILKKRDRGELTGEEIKFFIEGFSRGEIPDYQASAWAMAVALNGMSPRETADLTMALVHSGEQMSLAGVVDIAVDKHSSGGVGDKTSFVVLPLVAACGLPVGKMSGRGLGFSGGTLDKIESIPGYRVALTTDEFKKQLKEVGVVLCGQSVDLAPADGKLYSLRDVTGTVRSIPLIAASIMSKKIAAGAQAIVLDVKVGSGAFMETLDEARELVQRMTEIAELAHRKLVCLLSGMEQPLGHAVGNALELNEAIDTLHGRGPADFREHCLHVAAHMLVLGERAKTLPSARAMAEKSLGDESAFARFRALVEAQGGDGSYVDFPQKLPRAPIIQEVVAPRDGCLSRIDARIIGETSVLLGAGRAAKTDAIDHAVGIVVHHKVGDRIRRGERLFTLHAPDVLHAAEAFDRVLAAHQWSDRAVPALPLFYN